MVRTALPILLALALAAASAHSAVLPDPVAPPADRPALGRADGTLRHTAPGVLLDAPLRWQRDMRAEGPGLLAFFRLQGGGAATISRRLPAGASSPLAALASIAEVAEGRLPAEAVAYEGELNGTALWELKARNASEGTALHALVLAAPDGGWIIAEVRGPEGPVAEAEAGILHALRSLQFDAEAFAPPAPSAEPDPPAAMPTPAATPTATPAPTPRPTATPRATPTPTPAAPRVPPAEGAATRIGFVDVEIVIEESRAIRDMLGALDEEMADLARRIDRTQGEFESRRFDLDRQERILSADERERRRQELIALQDERNRLQFELERRLRAAERQMEPLLEEIMNVVADIAEREGFGIVLRGETVIYGARANDLTALVTAELDNRAERVRRLFDAQQRQAPPSRERPMDEPGVGRPDPAVPLIP